MKVLKEVQISTSYIFFSIEKIKRCELFRKQVKHSMQDGYIPQGGVSVIFRNNSSNTYLQAMYKPD